MTDPSNRADGADELVLSDPLAESSLVNTVPVHVPGMPLETRTDRAARLAKEAEPGRAPTKVPLPAEYDGIDTRSPEANLRTRSNIVRNG